MRMCHYGMKEIFILQLSVLCYQMFTIALDYALNRFTNIVDRLTVFEDNMRNNIDKTFGLIFSQRVLLALINKGMVREEAYDKVQPKAMISWETKTPFRELIEQDESITSVLTKEVIG